MQLVSGVAKLGMYIKKYIWQLCRNSFHRLQIAKKYLSLAVFACHISDKFVNDDVINEL